MANPIKPFFVFCSFGYTTLYATTPEEAMETAWRTRNCWLPTTVDRTAEICLFVVPAELVSKAIGSRKFVFEALEPIKMPS